MAQYNSLNVKLSNSQLNKLKSATKNETEVVLRLSSNMVGDNESSFPHELLLTNRQVSSLRKSFANNSSTGIKLSKSQLSKMIKSEGFIGRLLGLVLKVGFPLIKKVIKRLAKSVLIPVGLTAAAAAADARIHKKILGSGHNNNNNNNDANNNNNNNNNTTLIISNNEIEDIIKIVKTPEDSGLLLEEVTKTVQNEVKEKKGFLSILLGALGVSLLGNILTRKRSDRNESKTRNI